MKKALSSILLLAVFISFAACKTAVPDVTLLPTPSLITAPPTPALPDPALPTLVATPSPIPTPEPPPDTFGEVPDHAGSGDILFDIYVSKASVDLNKDGTEEKITFTRGKKNSTLKINDKTYKIDHPNLAQAFAVTDIDISDSILELAFTDKYDSGLADAEFAFLWLYWWDGTKLHSMGGLMDVKFDGAWRDSFKPKNYFDAHGIVKCLTRTQNFTDIWYTGHYAPGGTNRKLAEKLYEAKPLFNPEPVTAKKYILLLKKRTNDYFDTAHSVIWDYASGCGGYEGKPRNHTDSIVAFIPQSGEQLTVSAVYGKQWYQLKASDGKKGWLKCKDMKVFGYWPTLGANYTADNLFDGIVIAG